MKFPKVLADLILNDNALLITGEPQSGKSRLAHYISSEYSDTTFFPASDFQEGVDKFQFGICTQKTRLIIIENCPEDFEYGLFFGFISRGVMVEKLGKNRFAIYPQFIFVSTERPKMNNASFARRFDIFDLREHPEVIESLPILF